jgi:hypothetical protein
MDASMTGRNLPPRYRVITPDSETTRPTYGSRGPRRGDEAALDVAPPAAATAAEGDAPAWPLISLFLIACAIGGAGLSLFGLFPDLLS